MSFLRLLIVAAAGAMLGLGVTAPAGADVDIPGAPNSPPAISPVDGDPIPAKLRLAQAGSTGGTLGKPDQSLSGNRPTPPSKAPPQEKTKAVKQEPSSSTSACSKAVGVWYWVTQEVTIKAGGAITSPGGPGNWTCVDGKLHVFWPGFVVPHEIFSISDDGNRLISLNTASAPKRVR
jgi:hypothetical protein